jgi:hypothetical protein
MRIILSRPRSLVIANACSIVGRIVPLLIAQRVGPINILLTAGFTSGIMLFLWTLAKSHSGILAFDAIYGVSSGEPDPTRETILADLQVLLALLSMPAPHRSRLTPGRAGKCLVVGVNA